MNLYELNQLAYDSLPEITKDRIEEVKTQIKNCKDFNAPQYYMLVCNELKYYTLFHNKSHQLFWSDKLLDEVLEIVQKLGELKDIEIDGGMIEFWVSKDGECHMYAFFDYDRGVVEV